MQLVIMIVIKNLGYIPFDLSFLVFAMADCLLINLSRLDKLTSLTHQTLFNVALSNRSSNLQICKFKFEGAFQSLKLELFSPEFSFETKRIEYSIK